MPEVSVVLPTYNRRRLVQETIDSVLRQKFADLELIVVDDGSTDDTGRTLTDRYGPLIRYVYQENAGESAARNHGIALSRGKYVGFVDSDDLWHPDKLKRQVEILEANPLVGLVSTQAFWINYLGLQLRKAPDGASRQDDVISWAELVLDNVIAGGGSSSLIRRECLVKAGGFDQAIRFGEEWDLWIRIARDYRVVQIPTPLVYYRVNPFGTRGWAPRANEAEAMYREHLSIVAKAFEHAPQALGEGDHLEAKAYARLHLRHAMVNYGHGSDEAGRHYWQLAIDTCPVHATDEAVISQTLVNYAVGFASVAVPRKRVAVLQATVDRVLSNLPESVSGLTSRRNTLLAKCYAEMSFQAAMNGEAPLARRCAYRSVATESVWLRNRGLLKILLTGGRHLWPLPVTFEATDD